ncbi:hypothetical protein [uncultured Corynebacterium sp.]|uniref:hypothetical protein n=1 Tax=uncultured Corynebacterium sp. TaxID=159447 RepID=UPI0025E2AEDB|nr:hypothetical protein [uncultured Corynebacterium sp.]
MTSKPNPIPTPFFETTSGSHMAPFLHLTQRAVALVLPDCGEDWTVVIDDAPARVYRPEHTLRVSLDRPFVTLTATAGEHTFAFEGVRDRIFAVPARREQTRALFVPRGTTVSPEPLERRDSPWAGWAVVTVPAEATLDVQVPFQPAMTVEPAVDECFTWNTRDAQQYALPNAVTVDKEPVFTASPTIEARVPLTVELEYISPEGEREEVSEESIAPGTHEIFAMDTYEDPWVGRYCVTIKREGVAIDARHITIAEGLHIRYTNDGPRGTTFRSVDATGSLSPFNYTLAAAPKKPVIVTKGLRDLGNEPTRAEVVSSEAGYEAAFDIVPAAVTARFRYTGEEPVEFSAKRTILAGFLDEESHFTVHAPEGLPLAKFVSIDKRAKIKDLVSAGGSTVARRSLSISNAQLRDALGKQSSIELYLLWSTLTYEDYLAGLSAEERATHEAQDADRRQLEYEATAASDLIYAGLATVRKAPLATRAALADAAVALEWATEPTPADGEQAAGPDMPHVRAFAWELAHPTAAPVELERTAPDDDADAAQGQVPGFVAPQLEAPLVLDLRLTTPGSDLAVPTHPAASSLIVEGSSTPEALGIPTDPAVALSEYAALRGIGKHSRNATLAARLAALGERLSALAALVTDAGPEIAIETGLNLRAGTVEATPLPADDRTQPLLLQAALGTEDSADPRIDALRECFRNDIALHRLYVLRELRQTADVLASGLSGMDTSVTHTLIALQAFAAAPTVLKAAGSVPYVSYVFALAARALANGKAADGAATVEALLRDNAPRLAAVARLAPSLITYDLVTGEALTR